jgi:hypothetical protein
MVVYKACFDFIEIKGTYSGENLVYYVYKRYKKLGILYKILILTGDNASNNDTAACSLYKKLSYIYNDYLEENSIHNKSMRFQGKASKIDCLAHINNLIIKAILKELGSSIYKDIVAYLDRVKEYGWTEITILLASGNIAILYIIVL